MMTEFTSTFFLPCASNIYDTAASTTQSTKKRVQIYTFFLENVQRTFHHTKMIKLCIIQSTKKRVRIYTFFLENVQRTFHLMFD